MKIIILITLFVHMVYTQQHVASYLLLDETLGNCATILDAARTNDLEVVKIEIDLIGVNSKVTLKSMSSDFTYIIWAYGSTSRIMDLDLAVYADDGLTLITKDTNQSALAMVKVNPPESGYYILKLTAAKMVSGYESMMGQFCLVVTHN